MNGLPTLDLARLRLCLLSTFAALLFAPHAHAQIPVLTPDREADVLRLLQPFSEGAPILPDVTLEGIALGKTLRLELAQATGARATVEMLPQSTGPHSFVAAKATASTPELAAAQARLIAAILHNDDGRFFAGRSLPTTVVAGPRVPQWLLLTVQTAWWLLLVVLTSWLLTHLPTPNQLWRNRFWLAATLLAAVWAHERVPFAPLHSDGHAWGDLAIAINVPGHDADIQREMRDYGPAWFTLQRLLLAPWPTVTSVARLSFALWLAAIALTAHAAWRIGHSRPWTGLALFPLLLSPLGARVAQSESAFVVAQFLVALALATSLHASASATLLTALSLFLLTLGHPAGVLTAAALWLLTSALSPVDRRRRALLWLLPCLLGTALELWLSHDALADRQGAAPLQRFVSELLHGEVAWLQLGYAAPLSIALATIGALALARDQNPLMRRTARGAGLLGLFAILQLSALVHSCQTDLLRYQSVVAPVLGVLSAAAVPVRHAARPWRRWLTLALLPLVLLQWLTPKDWRLDAQANSWRVLVAHLGGQNVPLVLLLPDRANRSIHVILDAPVGRLGDNMPNVSVLRVTEALRSCQTTGQLPSATLIWLDHTCAARPLPGETSACSQILPFVDKELWRDTVRIQSEHRANGGDWEFSRYASDRVVVRLVTARCPAP